jgi:hypothetical protein
MPKSYAPQVIADNTGQWCGNALRFATKAEAEANVHDLMMRWTMVCATRVVESDDPVNYRYTSSKLEAVEPEPKPRPVPGPEATPLQCSICEGPIQVHGTWTQGHNAQPVNDGRCCDDCNAQVVIPRRLVDLYSSQRK